MKKITYRDAGVDIDAQDDALARIKSVVASTRTKGVLADIGSFGGMFLPDWKGRKDPVLVASCDGVGTKLKLAFETGIHDTVGRDLVNHCVNDILVQGATPLFFLDYVATGRLAPAVLAAVVEGIASGCRDAGCALLGGETAELPGFYAAGEYDLAGFAVGVVEKRRIIDGRTIAPGDVLIGLASSGPHSNGFSLIRRILEVSGADLRAPFDGSDGRTLGDALLAPTRIYVKPLLALMNALPVKGMAHITGGGLVENVPRMLADGLQARLESGRWPRPAIFRHLQHAGRVDENEMHRVFNCGIGMVVAVAPADAERAVDLLRGAGEDARPIGHVAVRPADAPRAVVA